MLPLEQAVFPSVYLPTLWRISKRPQIQALGRSEDHIASCCLLCPRSFGIDEHKSLSHHYGGTWPWRQSDTEHCIGLNLTSLRHVSELHTRLVLDFCF